MTNKRKGRFSLSSFLKNSIFIIPNLFRLLNHLISISTYEAKLAMRSLVVIFLLSFIGVAIATTTWLALLAMLYIYLISILWTPLAAISMVVLVNVLILLVLAVIILRVKNNLLFSETRKQLQVVRQFYRD